MLLNYQHNVSFTSRRRPFGRCTSSYARIGQQINDEIAKLDLLSCKTTTIVGGKYRGPGFLLREGVEIIVGTGRINGASNPSTSS